MSAPAQGVTPCHCAACQTGAGQCFSKMSPEERAVALNLNGPVGKGRPGGASAPSTGPRS